MFNDNRRSRCLFCNILPIYKIPCGISNAIINILEEILQSDPFLMLRNFEEMQGCNGTESKGINLFSRIKRIMEQGLGHLFNTSNSSQFFNKTDLEQYAYLFTTRSTRK